MLLAGDIGGTKTLLAIFSKSGDQLVSVGEETYASRDYEGLEGILVDFLSKFDFTIRRACFGIAGPVQQDICRTSNLPWIVDARLLANNLGLKNVTLLNDLEATAYGVDVIPATDILTLRKGSDDPTGNRAVIAAGTGLGEAGLVWNGEFHVPVASEGGHSDFAPRNSTEFELLQFLHRKFAHVSYERVLSGPGLVNVYEFLRERHPDHQADTVYQDVQKTGAAAITDAAINSLCPVCEQALDLFISLYGAEAGNLALKFLATGGVYVAGGIAGRIASQLRHTFETSFVGKGRMQPILEQIPVHVITTNRTALLGAAEYALSIERVCASVG